MTRKRRRSPEELLGLEPMHHLEGRGTTLVSFAVAACRADGTFIWLMPIVDYITLKRGFDG